MKTLVIPDLHQHPAHADYWIDAIPADRVVFLGDYFDDYHDTPEEAEAMAEWLRQRVEANPDWVFLTGNHDLPYLFPLDDRFIAQGFRMSKREEIGGVIRGMDRSRFQLGAWVEGDILLSHAGLHPGWLRRAEREAAEHLLKEAESALMLGQWHPLLSWGQDRGGMSWHPSIGGITWMDWNSLRPLPFCHQIVGHTPSEHPRHRTWYGWCNLCLDVGHGMVAAVIERKSAGGKSVRVMQRLGSRHKQVLEADMA